MLKHHVCFMLDWQNLTAWAAGVASNTSNHQPSSLRRTQPCEGGWVQYGIRPFSLLLDQICLRRKHLFGCWWRLVKLYNIQNEGQPCKRNSLTSWCCAALTLALVLLGSELRGSSALARATAAPFYCGIILPLKKKPDTLVHLWFTLKLVKSGNDLLTLPVIWLLSLVLE